METFTFIAFIFLMYFLLTFSTYQNHSTYQEPFMASFTDMELGSVNVGNSSSLENVGNGTYSKEISLPEKNRIPFIFTQLYGKNTYSLSLQDVTRNSFHAKIQRTDQPHQPWNEDLKLMYGAIYLENKNPHCLNGLPCPVSQQKETTYTKYTNKDSPGYDLGPSKNTNIAEAKNICTSNPSCKGFVMNNTTTFYKGPNWKGASHLVPETPGSNSVVYVKHE
jgi:hypothetical protein